MKSETSKNISGTFAKRLQIAMNFRKIKASELAEKANIPKSAISQYLSGLYEAKQKNIFKLSQTLDVNEAWLMGLDVPMESKTTIKDTINMHSGNNRQCVPLIGNVKAGYNYLASENYIGYVSLDNPLSDQDKFFALQVTGDSMQPILYEHDIVIVRKQNDIENGKIGIVLINGEEVTIKKIIKHDDYIELISFNSYYPPKKLTKKDDIKIIGEVIEARISKIFE